VSVVITRLCQTFGAGVAYDDNRVFAQFARSVIEKKDIVLRTKGETYRNYCYTRDAVVALFLLLCKGRAGEVYNIANFDTGISTT
jgi:dTDP-glucose 4,6-dehydratase